MLVGRLYDGTLPLTGAYSLSLTATNDRLLMLPATGKNEIWTVTIAVTAFFLTAVTILKQMKKEIKNHE